MKITFTFAWLCVCLCAFEKSIFVFSPSIYRISFCFFLFSLYLKQILENKEEKIHFHQKKTKENFTVFNILSPQFYSVRKTIHNFFHYFHVAGEKGISLFELVRWLLLYNLHVYFCLVFLKKLNTTMVCCCCWW